MLQTLVVGLGRAGAGLHLPVLSRARALAASRPLFADRPIVACDPRRRPEDAPAETIVTASIAAAARLLDPDRAVAHVCTPPTVRAEVLAELAELGFRRILVEKPLAVNAGDLARITRMRQGWGLHLEVVSPWQASALTLRLLDLVHGKGLGELRWLSTVQHKPRFRRSQMSSGHPTAFDVEMPHSVGVALRLAGNAEVASAECVDLDFGGEVAVPRMGGARIELRHSNGVRTEIVSDLMSPVRERRITLGFERGVAVGHYAVSEDDDHAQLSVSAEGREEHTVFRDDALLAWLLRAYEGFHASHPADKEFALAAEVVRLLCTAKSVCAGREGHQPFVAASRNGMDHHAC